MSGHMERTRNMTRARLLRTGLPVALVASFALPLAGATQAGARIAPAQAAPSKAAPTVAAAALALALPRAGGAAVGIDLCATTGTTMLPGVTSPVPVLGYVLGDCTLTNTVSTPGGPAIVVDEGDVVTVTLHNNLTEATGLLFPGQTLVPDRVGVAGGGMKIYSFTAKTGTSLYEAALLPGAQHQSAMGLVGALVVKSATVGQAYAQATSAYDEEAAVVVSELDPALNSSANPAAFDMRTFKPTFGLINGKASPSTDPIPAVAGHKLLLRMVNGGSQPHSLGLLGLRQTVIANDGSELRYSHNVVADTVGPGQSADALISIPAGAPAGSKFAFYDASAGLHNAGANGTGGMLTFIATAAGTANTAPVTTNVSVSPNPALTTTASVTLTGTITPTPDAAEYFIDTLGANGTGCPVTPASAVSAVITTIGGTSPCGLATLTAGNHSIYLHGLIGTDWGTAVSTALTVTPADTQAPITSGLSVTPALTNGADPVINATGDDSTTGGSRIQAIEYFIGTSNPMLNGSGAALAITPPIDATVSAGATIPFTLLSAGVNVISVHSQDSAGNWGLFATINVTTDTVGPVTSLASASPNPTNGVIGVNSSTPAVRVSASASDALTNTVAAEGFIDTVGAPGSGFVFFPTDGLFSSLSESVYYDIQLTAVQGLSNGIHTIYVRSKDAAGNWGATISTALVVDKVAPTTNAIAATPNPTNVSGGTNTSFLLTANATDAGAGGGSPITAAEWYQNPAPAAGSGTPMTATDGTFSSSVEPIRATIDFVALGWAAGNHTIFVRSRDAAGSWSNSVSVTVNVVYPNIFTNGFDSGTLASRWGWSALGGTTARLAVTNGQAQGGSARRLDVTVAGGGAATSGFVQDNSPNAEASYHGRFYINPLSLVTGTGATPQAITLFKGMSGDGTGNTVFSVEYRRSTVTGAANNRAQVRLNVTRSGGTTSTNWFNIADNTYTSVEVAWASGASATSSLSTGGTVRQNLTGLNTSANTLGSVQLGLQGTLANISGTIRIDSFVSTKTTVIGN
jgi:FtsP/CotA-like multicopper oxidase with cupredoxin domain